MFESLLDTELFSSLPRAGAHLAPRLLVAFGAERGRFPSAQALMSYVGIAPVKEESGKPLVRRIQAEDPDDAWEVAETLGTNLVDVVDIPPTGDVKFVENEAIPKTWQMDRQDLSVE